ETIVSVVRQGITLVPTAIAFASIVRQWDRYRRHDFHRNIPARWEAEQTSIRKAIAAGARVATGSDTDDPPDAPFGGVAEEACLLAELGLSPSGALAAATRVAAEALGV